jgi:plastocyanin
MKTWRFLAVAALFLALVPPVPALAATRSVTIPANFFSPQTIKVHTGDTVRWSNNTNTHHTVTSNSDSSEFFGSSMNCGFLSGSNDCIKPGRSFSHTFPRRGTFTYHCRIHGSDAPFPNCGMCGRVTVVGKSQPTTIPTSTASPTSGHGGSPSPSSSPSASPTSTASVTPTSSALAAPGESGTSSSTIVTVAAVLVLLLAGSGFVVYRTMIRRG